jgi:hypothetical protein
MSARRRRVGIESEHQNFHQDPSCRKNNENEKLLASIQQQQELVIPTMTSRDRTQEFGNAIRSMQSRTASRTAALGNPRQAKHLQTYSNFMMIAKNIGKNIASTYTKLEKLALRKKTYTFNSFLLFFLFNLSTYILDRRFYFKTYYT